MLRLYTHVLMYLHPAKEWAGLDEHKESTRTVRAALQLPTITLVLVCEGAVHSGITRILEFPFSPARRDKDYIFNSTEYCIYSEKEREKRTLTERELRPTRFSTQVNSSFLNNEHIVKDNLIQTSR